MERNVSAFRSHACMIKGLVIVRSADGLPRHLLAASIPVSDIEPSDLIENVNRMRTPFVLRTIYTPYSDHSTEYREEKRCRDFAAR